MLKHHKADIEDIKMDMRYFLKELIKKEIVTPHRTILFVKCLFIQGKSLGSHLACYLASRIEVHSCIQFCGFWSISRIVQQKTAIFLGKMIQQPCDNAEYLKDVKCPVLVIHGMKVG